MRNLLEIEIGEVWVEGEVSNLRRQASGHCYFTLKDSGAQISCVLFKGNGSRAKAQPEDGMQVRIFAEVSLYETRGQLQLIVKQVEKIVDVIHCTEHTPTDAVVRELALVKLKLKSKERADALQILEHFGAKTVDLTETSMIATIHGASDKVDAAVRLLGQFEIVETVRTGKVVMARGEQET